MLILEKDGSTLPPRFYLKGVVDDTADFKSLFAGLGNSIDLYCRDVTRINSVGVKLWTQHFTEYRQAGGAIRFYELSPPLVATLNTVFDFAKKNEVMSIGAPFLCPDCDKVTIKVVSAADAKTVAKSDPTIPCSFCEGEAEFDDLPAQYFSWLIS